MRHLDKIIAIVDTREQEPLDLEKHGLTIIRKALPFGDYSLLVPDLTRHLAVERKSLPDFVSCCGREHERFRKELLALRGYSWKFVICEFSLTALFQEEYRSKISSNVVLGCLSSWLNLGIVFLFADTREQAACLLASLLMKKAQEVIAFSKCSLESKESAFLAS